MPRFDHENSSFLKASLTSAILIHLFIEEEDNDNKVDKLLSVFENVHIK